MITRRVCLQAAPLLASGLWSRVGVAQTLYPSRSVRVVVPTPPGADAITRIVCERASQTLGQSLLVDNRPGAAGVIGSEAVAKAEPDGYTLLYGFNSHVTTNPYLYSKLNFNPVRDLVPVIEIVRGNYALIVTPSLPYANVNELIAAAKAKPDSLKFANPGQGTLPHLAQALFQKMSGTTFIEVPYGRGSASTDLMAGTVDVLFEPIFNALPLHRAGKVRILAVSSLRRQESMPELPTISESVPGFEAVGWHAVFAPRGTPDPIVQRLNQVFNETLRARDVAERLTSLGVTVSGGSSQQVVQAIKVEGDKWSKLIAEIGLKLD